MGIIQKQALKGTIYSYLGVVVGFLTAGLLFPNILSTDEIGVINLLVSFSVLFAQFASLGFNSVIDRLFPYFRNLKKGHNGFLTIALLVTLIGFLLSFTGFEFLKPIIVRNNINNSALFVDYINYILPLIFFTLLFNLLDSYNKAIYDAVLGTFLKEFIQRIFILVSLLFFYFKLIDIQFFIRLYIISVSLPTIILVVILFLRGEFQIMVPDKEIFDKTMIREMLRLCFFGIVSGLGSLAIIHVDKILVNKFLGLSSTGIYATNYFFAALVIIPSRALLKISTTVLADSWKRKDLKNIFIIYKKSAINQGIISFLIFAGLWINMHNIYRILPAEYSAGRWVIIFIALANVLNMISGVSATIISTSVKYRIITYLMLIYAIVAVGLNYLLIPLFGITGAALAFLIANMVFNFLKYLYVFKEFEMNPYDSKFIILLLITVFSAFVSNLIPEMDNLILDIALRSTLMTILFALLVYVARISDDVNYTVNKFLKR